jgi:hypothetical protein
MFPLRLLLLCSGLFVANFVAFGSVVEIGKNAKLQIVKPDGVYIEPYLAVDPADPQHLISAAFMFPPFGKYCSIETFVSFDGGTSWERHEINEAYPDVADPWVAFGRNGTVYLSYLATNVEAEDAVGRVFASSDRGKTWKGPISLPREATEFVDDHPTITVDTRNGPYSGNVYVTTNRNARRGISRTVFPIHIFVSRDGGRSFSKPVQILPNDFNNINSNAVILSDGSIAVAFAEVNGVNADKKPITLHQRVWVVKSQDGGQTFSNPFLVTEQDKIASAPILAVDTSSGRFRDQLYVVANGPGSLHLWIGKEKGERWRDTVIPDTNETGEAYHHRNPALAVDDQGVVMVAWPERLGTTNAGCTEIYLAASLDGGKSFLPKSRVSTAASCFDQPGNRIPVSEKSKRTVGERWQAGGDYLGLAAGRNGMFHLIWADSREGHFSLWTSAATIHNASH